MSINKIYKLVKKLNMSNNQIAVLYFNLKHNGVWIVACNKYNTGLKPTDNGYLYTENIYGLFPIIGEANGIAVDTDGNVFPVKNIYNGWERIKIKDV